MSNFLIIVFCLFAGHLLRRFKVVRADGYRGINAWIIYIGLPATSFRYLPDLVWDNQLLLCMLAPAAILLGSVAFIALCRGPLGLSRRSAHTLMLVSGFSNTSFVGFPLVSSYFGEGHIRYAIISDQVTFLLLSAVGTIIAIRGSRARDSAIPLSYILRRVFSFPPLWGCLLAITLPRYMAMDAFRPFFAQLASTVSPLALFSIGMQLSFNIYRSELVVMGFSLAYKLLLGPFLLLGMCYALRIQGDVAQVAVFEMAMPSLVATSLLLEQFNLNTKLGNAVIGLSILLGLLSSWLAYQAIILLL